MDELAVLFTILVFLFYAAVAGVFIYAGFRRWVWPLIRQRLPEVAPSERRGRRRCGDQERITS